MKFVHKHWFKISIILIVLFSIFLRFYNYNNRLGVSYDQAYGAMVAKYSLDTRQIPLLGPFSSAGPFQTGGEWYWFIMLGYLLGFESTFSPWILLSATSVLFVLLIIFISKEIIDEKFAVIVGLLACVSTSQIAQSFSLTNQSVISLFSALSVLFLIIYLKTRRDIFLFLMGLSSSTAMTIHLQGAALMFLIISTLVFCGKPKIKSLASLFLGLIIPLLPIIVFDFQNNFINSKNMLQYFLHDQYKISLDVLGRRWLTYLWDFWPNSFAHIIGGDRILGIFTILFTIFTLIHEATVKKLSRFWIILILSFVPMLTYLRYLRTPLFDSYLMFIHPFIFLLVGFSIYILFIKNKALGIIVLVVILLGSIKSNVSELKVNGNNSSKIASDRMISLKTKFPREKFSVYTYKYKWSDQNLILGLFLYTNNLISEDGKKISVVVATEAAEFNFPIISGEQLGYKLVDLSSLPISKLKSEWGRVDPIDIYNVTENWYKK